MFLCEEDGFLIWLTIFCILWDLWGLYQLILSSLYLGLFPNSWNQNINWCILSKDEWKNMTYWLPSETGMSLHMNKEKKLFEYSNCSFLFCWITIETRVTLHIFSVCCTFPHKLKSNSRKKMVCNETKRHSYYRMSIFLAYRLFAWMTLLGV